MTCPNCNAANIDRMHTCDRESPITTHFEALLAVAYSTLLVNNSSLIVERKPGDRGFLHLVGR
jgi:hypothetical protein